MVYLDAMGVFKFTGLVFCSVFCRSDAWVYEDDGTKKLLDDRTAKGQDKSESIALDKRNLGLPLAKPR